jgi:hypothetical protein
MRDRLAARSPPPDISRIQGVQLDVLEVEEHCDGVADLREGLGANIAHCLANASGGDGTDVLALGR